MITGFNYSFKDPQGHAEKERKQKQIDLHAHEYKVHDPAQQEEELAHLQEIADEHQWEVNQSQ